jgi:hypothetical protein
MQAETCRLSDLQKTVLSCKYQERGSREAG